MFAFLFCCFTFSFQNTLFVMKIAIPFAMLINLVYLTYCKICNRLQRYQDTDSASLRVVVFLQPVN